MWLTVSLERKSFDTRYKSVSHKKLVYFPVRYLNFKQRDNVRLNVA